MHATPPVNPLLHDIRSFLRTHGHEVPPWGPAHAPLDVLYRLLRRRHADDALWNDLSTLTSTVATSRRSSGGALSHAAIDGLLDELRHTLGQDTTTVPLRRWATTAPIAALSGFLLLGAAMGCTTPGNDDDDDDSATQEAICQEAIDHEIPEAEADVFCQIVDIIESSSGNDAIREQLMECLTDLSADQRQELLDAFLTAGADELAELLEEAAYSGEWCGTGDDDDDTINDH
jgi:hypothetical protein